MISHPTDPQSPQSADMQLDARYYLCAIIAVTISGLAKGGFTGMGALAMPIMALGIDPVRGASILLPIMVMQDSVSVWTYRRSWDRQILMVMLPGMAIGIGFGYLFAATVPERAVVGAVGAISFVFGLHRLVLDRRSVVAAIAHSPAWIGTLFGLASGFAGQIAHAGAPPFQIWVTPRGLPRDTLIGTSAMAFAAMNWMKVPAFAALGQFTWPNLVATLLLVPFALLSTIGGVQLARRIDPARFYSLIYVIMVLLGAKLMFTAAGFHF